METIDRWLKSLRLHKYTNLFKCLSYEQMLNLDEKFLTQLEVTKGARNKILVSVKKLNLRQERLANMIDDLNQDNISMKEALTFLKDMLITPIPSPLNKPHDLTYLFVETFEKVALRLIETVRGIDDNACHGIMATIVDECLKHNSFSSEQKARVASFKQHFTINGQRAKMASLKQQLHRAQQRGGHVFNQHACGSNGSGGGYNNRNCGSHHHHYHYNSSNTNSNATTSNNSDEEELQNHHRYQYHSLPTQQQQQHHQQQQNQLLQQQPQQLQQQQPVQSQLRLQQDLLHSQKHQLPQQQLDQQQVRLQLELLQLQKHQHQQQQQPRPQSYREYSLLGPGMTFELPCLRAMAERNRW